MNRCDLHGLPKGTLDPDPNQQCLGEVEPGDHETDPGGWQLPGRPFRPDVGGSQAEACRGDPVGIETVSGHDGQASKTNSKKGGP